MRMHAPALFCLLLLASPAFCDTVHVLQAGETLYSIARRYGVKLEDLLHDNGIDAGSVTKVRAGTKLTIRGVGEAAPAAPSPAKPPAYATHTVARNETLWSISRGYGLELEELLAANPGVDAGRLYVGAKLRVPVAEPRAAPVIPAASAPEPKAPPADALAPPPAAKGPAPAADLWPHPGPRTSVTDGHFKHTRIAGKPGDPVVAVSSGRVTWVSPYRTYRNVVMIETRTASAREAYQFLYAGIEDVYVRAGDWVEKGATIARMAADGLSDKGEVLFAVYQGATRTVDHTRLSWQ